MSGEWRGGCGAETGPGDRGVALVTGEEENGVSDENRSTAVLKLFMFMKSTAMVSVSHTP